MFQVPVFWVVTSYIVVLGYISEDEGCIHLWNVGILPQHYTASHHRTLRHKIKFREHLLFQAYNFLRNRLIGLIQGLHGSRFTLMNTVVIPFIFWV